MRNSRNIDIWGLLLYESLEISFLQMAYSTSIMVRLCGRFSTLLFLFSPFFRPSSLPLHSVLSHRLRTKNQPLLSFYSPVDVMNVYKLLTRIQFKFNQKQSELWTSSMPQSVISFSINFHVSWRFQANLLISIRCNGFPNVATNSKSNEFILELHLFETVSICHLSLHLLLFFPWRLGCYSNESADNKRWSID